MTGPIETREGEPSWVRYIKLRIERNKNFLCFVSGTTGSGKSYSCLRIAEMLDPSFNINRVVFSGSEMMQVINSNELSKGSVLVFEEAGVGLSSRNWQSTLNKMLSFLLQTFRHRCIVVLFNAPFVDYMDVQARKLLHAEFQTMSIDAGEKKVKIKPLLLQYNGRQRKMYYKYLRVRAPNGILPITRWSVGLPSDGLRAAYEEKKRLFTDALNKEIQQEFENPTKRDKKAGKIYSCDYCSHEWRSRSVKRPAYCPKCKKNM